MGKKQNIRLGETHILVIHDVLTDKIEELEQAIATEEGGEQDDLLHARLLELKKARSALNTQVIVGQYTERTSYLP